MRSKHARRAEHLLQVQITKEISTECPLKDHSRYALKLPQLGAHLHVELPTLYSIRYLRTWIIESVMFGNLLRFEIGCETF
jgi:hypothetical protein